MAEKKTSTKKKVVEVVTSSFLTPVMTEKAARLNMGRVYTFLVPRTATKLLVRDAVIATYKVTPVSITVVNVANRTAPMRNRRGTMIERGYKKAYVTLGPKDSIALAV
jgi:ribosomal protein L23